MKNIQNKTGWFLFKVFVTKMESNKHCYSLKMNVIILKWVGDHLYFELA